MHPLSSVFTQRISHKERSKYEHPPGLTPPPDGVVVTGETVPPDGVVVTGEFVGDVSEHVQERQPLLFMCIHSFRQEFGSNTGQPPK